VHHYHANHAPDRTADRTIEIDDIDVRTRDNFTEEDEENDPQEEEDFYDNNEVNNNRGSNNNDDIRAVRVKLMGKKDLILPDISQKSGGSSQVNSAFENGLVANNRRS